MRVIGGELRGRRLYAPPGERTRPTAGRAREGLFSWLAGQTEGAHVLDIFAGTGALGIEALSRGADEAVFIERDRAAAGALARNLRELDLEPRATVFVTDASQGVARLLASGRRFDLMLADPPYAKVLPDLLERVQLAGLLRGEGSLILERKRGTNADCPLPLPGLVFMDSRHYGQTSFDWYRKHAAQGVRGQEERR